MNYMTTTDLRTKSSQLVTTLQEGNSVSLIHRSRVIGTIKPEKKKPKIFTSKSIEKLKKLTKQLNLPSLSYAERERNYRKHIMDKYGKGLS